MSLYYLPNARYEDQAEQMRRLEAAGVCIFCPPHVNDPADPAVVHSNERWVIRQNTFPYRGSRLHLLVVPLRHVTDLLDLPHAELTDFWDAVRWARAEYGLTYYGLGARCGDFSRTGGTIAHVHVHLLVGDSDNPDHTPVRLRLSSVPGGTPQGSAQGSAQG